MESKIMENRPRNVVVLGPIPRDKISTYQDETVEKYGCAIYTTAVLSTLLGEGSRIVPVVHVRKTDLEPIRAILAGLPSVDTSHVSADLDSGDVITLNYVSQSKRVEQQTGFMNPIVPQDLKGLLDFDAFVFVPVTDFEVSLGTLEYIKSNSNGIIIFDAHGPTNGCSRNGQRFLKFWIDRDLWLPHIDILKMNLEEAACCWFEPEYEAGELENLSDMPIDELPKFAMHCLNVGVKSLIVTLDEYGCAVYFKDEKGQIQEHFVKRIHVENVVDTTGCGDSFAGGLAYGYLKTGCYLEACYFGNAAGAQRCTGTELSVYKNVDETERQIADAYRN